MATVEDKIQRIITRLENNTSLKNLVPGTTMHSLVEASAFENMKVETAKELMEVKQSISLSGGQDLDRIGEKVFGVQRRQAIAPSISSNMKLLKFYVTTGTFGSINNGNDIIVQKGTIIEGAIPSGYLRFATRNTVTLGFNESEKYVDADLVSGPYDIIPANSLTKHDVSSYAGASNGSLKVTNTSTIATGMPPESDENYRYRISTALQAFAKSNYYGVHEAITALPGISDVSIYSADNGGGTFTAYVKSISPIASAQLLDDVKKAIYQCVPPWVNFNVIGPSYVGLKLNISIELGTTNTSTFDTLKQKVINTVSTFINNVKSNSIDIKQIEGVVVGSDPLITDATITAATIYRGDTFRAATVIDLEDSVSRYIGLENNEELIVEPIRNAILVSIQ